METQDELYQTEPNLLAETYRNQSVNDKPRQIEKHFDFIDISEGKVSSVCGFKKFVSVILHNRIG